MTDECWVLCETEGIELARGPYGRRVNPAKVGICATIGRLHGATFPDHVLRYGREPLDVAEERRRVLAGDEPPSPGLACRMCGRAFALPVPPAGPGAAGDRSDLARQAFARQANPTMRRD
jgi:hypothetical protein